MQVTPSRVDGVFVCTVHIKEQGCMKKHIVAVVLAVALLCLCAAQNYKLYPTKSTNLFIKLDTRNGKMTYVTVYSDTLAGSCWRVEHTKGTVVPFELRGEL